MNIYISARFTRLDECKKLASELMKAGHHVLSRWMYVDRDDLTKQQGAAMDFDDIDHCSYFVFLTEPKDAPAGSGERHVELGYAIAQGRRCFMIGEPENYFHYHPRVIRCKNTQDLIKWMREGKIDEDS